MPKKLPESPPWTPPSVPGLPMAKLHGTSLKDDKISAECEEVNEKNPPPAEKRGRDVSGVGHDAPQHGNGSGRDNHSNRRLGTSNYLTIPFT